MAKKSKKVKKVIPLALRFAEEFPLSATEINCDDVSQLQAILTDIVPKYGHTFNVHVGTEGVITIIGEGIGNASSVFTAIGNKYTLTHTYIGVSKVDVSVHAGYLSWHCVRSIIRDMIDVRCYRILQEQTQHMSGL